METGELIVLRPGGVTAAQITETTGVAPLLAQKTAQAAAQLAPGMLESHYAPAKKLLPLEAPIVELKTLPAEATHAKSLGVLIVSGDPKTAELKLAKLTQAQVVVHTLSKTGDPAEMARNLFAALRELDHSEAELLLTEPAPEGEGLQHAIADRLKRASAPKT
jgi:L-threonylcarbamoyladenylate synthase